MNPINQEDSHHSIHSLIDDTQSPPCHLRENDFIGPPTPDNKPDKVFRLYFGNPCGLNLGISGGDFKEYIEEMKRLQVDYLGLAEINIDLTKASNLKKLHTSAKKHL
jgi:hypothetical protein